ncbi:MAG: c-type cytochrome [Gemmatimonadaceae bacterium]
MRHVAVRRTALLLAVVVVGCTALFTWLVSREAEPWPAPPTASEAEGAALFREYCASCHTVERMRAGVANADAVRRRELLRFLQHHGRSSDAEDRLILDYLWAGAASVLPHSR